MDPTIRLKYKFRDGTLIVSKKVSIPISDLTLHRHRLLHVAKGESRTLEEAFAEFGSEYDPEDEASYIANPSWEDYDDLHFAQILFQSSMRCHFDDILWDDTETEPMRVASPEAFTAAIRDWVVRTDADVNCDEAERDKWSQALPKFLEAGEAALRLDAATLGAIMQPLLKSL